MMLPGPISWDSICWEKLRRFVRDCVDENHILQLELQALNRRNQRAYVDGADPQRMQLQLDFDRDHR